MKAFVDVKTLMRSPRLARYRFSRRGIRLVGLPASALLGFMLGVAVHVPVQAQQEPTGSESADRKETSEMTATTQPKHTNRLRNATSPYLLQHMHNPVDWYEWSEEAFEEAKKKDKPIFLSIGYAACHWCHVMEHESFEDEEVAKVLNDDFVSIKVDREERPDIDEIYMAYTQAATGRGGWPMSVWLKPTGEPFYAGTYFPKEQFVQLLGRIREVWEGDREQLVARSKTAREYFEQWASGPKPAEDVIPAAFVDQSARLLAKHFDSKTGGLPSGTNKFPPSMAMELMLRVYRRTGDSALWNAVETTLDHMSRGGIYDHLGGGICRYSTDPEWLVPHFEKMLYDQALVSAIYLDAYQASRNPYFAEVAADMFDYVMYDLQSPEGGFYSSRDADSNGLEGKFYIWTKDEILKTLGPEEGELFCKYYDVTESGNWFERLGHAPPGPKNILHISHPPEAFAKLHGMSVEELRRKIAAWRQKLRTVRDQRTPPPLDDKVLTGWNGLMIAGLAKGARVLDEPKYAQAAAKAANFVLDNLRTDDGRLLRTWRKGEARLTGYLSDYAFFIEGLLNLYEATFDQRWLEEAVKLTDLSIKHYADEKDGGFYFTAHDAEKLLARSKNPHDGAIPSGNSVHAMNLLRLGILYNRKDYREQSERLFRAFAPQAEESPAAFERLNCAADFLHDKVKEIAIIGDPKAETTRAMIRAVYDQYLPNKVVVGSADRVGDSPIALLARKTLKDGLPTAYVCENYLCQEPVTTAEALAKQLKLKPSAEATKNER
jgi:uncharacterized protein